MGFTQLTSAHSPQDKRLWNEIRVAINRRLVAMGHSAVHREESMVSVTLKDLVNFYQLDVDWISDSFADSLLPFRLVPDILVNGNFGKWSSMSSHGGEYRRIPEGGSPPQAWDDYNAAGWDYGRVQNKDLLGLWVIQDLQNKLKELTRQRIKPSSDNPFMYFTRTYNSGYSLNQNPLFDISLQYDPYYDSYDTINYNSWASRVSYPETGSFNKRAGNYYFSGQDAWVTRPLAKYTKTLSLCAKASRGQGKDFYELLKFTNGGQNGWGENVVGAAIAGPTEDASVRFDVSWENDFAGCFGHFGGDFDVENQTQFFLVVDWEFGDGDTQEQPWEIPS